ncbi:MAG TPA: LptA/OstA family protein [Verrucomicrobiae bacterium]|nr:LptA/OstA family protein [Verrucomicrobiae bacterium]
MNPSANCLKRSGSVAARPGVSAKWPTFNGVATVGSKAGLAVTAIALIFTVSTARVGAQAFGPTKNYRIAQFYDPPHESQKKSLLEGETARRLPDGRWSLTNATVRTFSLRGEPDLIATTPECLYNPEAHSVDSTGPLHAQLANGSFAIEGEGFLWQETNSCLLLSNRVHTVVHPKMLSTDPHQAPRSPSDQAAEPLDIFSRHFAYTNDAGLALYDGDVRVAGTNLSLTSDRLIADLPMEGRQLRSITAGGNVVIDYTNTAPIHATGQRAVYTASTGLIQLTGNPTWRADQRQGHGDELVIDRTNRVFDAIGHSWLRMPAQNSSAFAFLSNSNTVPGAAGSATNRFIEVSSRRYQFRTNSAAFRDEVQLAEFQGEQRRGTMNCARLTAWFAGSNQLDTLLAETNVVIQGETNRMTAGKALYTATNGWLELTEHPTWKSGDRGGAGGLIRVMDRGDQMLVRGAASLRLPAKDLGTPQLLGPGTNSLRKPSPKTATDQFADVTCRQYTLRPDYALFEQDVRARHPQMNWYCQRLEVRSYPPKGNILFATGGVDFDFTNEKGQRMRGRGDNVVYTNLVTAALTNDVVYLRGNKAVLFMTNNFGLTNQTIIWDRTRNVVSAPGGDYKAGGTTKTTSTNMIRLPKSGGRK